MLRVACVADLHGHLVEVPPCDVLLLGGDLCPADDHGVSAQADWLDGPFRTWLEEAPAEEIVGIAGNHDFVFERAPALLPADLPWVYLQDHAETLACGLTVWGSPWTPWFFDWAFNAPRVGGEDWLARRYASIAPGCDIVLAHGPPRGFGDLTFRGEHVGSTALLEAVDEVVPRLCVFGHIHEGRGAWQRGATRLVNAAAVDERYALRDDPVVIVEL